VGSKLVHFSVQSFPAMRVIGKTTGVKEPTTLDDPTIENLWETMARDGSLELLHSLPGRVNQAPDTAGWMGDFQPGDNAYTYLAGVLFQPDTVAPDGFTYRDIEAADLAVGWIKGIEGDEGGDMMANASGHLAKARQEHGYEYDGSHGLFEMEVYTYERFHAPLERGGQPVLDFYSPSRKSKDLVR
jgi:predicted transcriptional regulator YdeE